MMPDVQNILLIKPSSLGDIVHAMPTLAALRRLYPAADVTWLVKRQWAGVVERIEGVDRIWSVDPGLQGWISRVPALRQARFDLVVDLQGLFRSAAMGWLSGSRRRIGFANGREGSPWFYTLRVAVPSADMHAVDRYLLVAKALGANISGAPRFNFQIPQSDREFVDRLLAQAGLQPGAAWIGMNVSARWPTKRWPAASFAAVADRIQESNLGRVVLIGGPGERAHVAEVKHHMKTPPIDVAGASTVGLLPALLAGASLLVTNDSGPMHIAAAVGTPVVALFGPTSPVRTGPYGDGHRILRRDLPCSPCFSRTCRHAVPLACLAEITPDEVWSAVKDIERRPAANLS